MRFFRQGTRHGGEVQHRPDGGSPCCIALRLVLVARVHLRLAVLLVGAALPTDLRVAHAAPQHASLYYHAVLGELSRALLRCLLGRLVDFVLASALALRRIALEHLAHACQLVLVIVVEGGGGALLEQTVEGGCRDARKQLVTRGTFGARSIG